MIFEVIIQEPAREDLMDIYLYISVKLKSPINAEKQLARLEERINKLDYLPERHPRYSEEPWKSRGYRVMLVDHYSIYYVTNLPAKVVQIMRVMYSRRDSNQHLGADTNLETTVRE